MLVLVTTLIYVYNLMQCFGIRNQEKICGTELNSLVNIMSYCKLCKNNTEIIMYECNEYVKFVGRQHWDAIPKSLILTHCYYQPELILLANITAVLKIHLCFPQIMISPLAGRLKCLLARLLPLKTQYFNDYIFQI